MKNYMFLINGKRAGELYTSDGLRVYFPDKHNINDLTVGTIKM